MSLVTVKLESVDREKTLFLRTGLVFSFDKTLNEDE